MTSFEKQLLLAEFICMLDKTIPTNDEVLHNKNNSDNDLQIEMLTIKECAEFAKGISEHTIRQLVRQNKISYVRTGKGANGKILVNKKSLLHYIENPS